MTHNKKCLSCQTQVHNFSDNLDHIFILVPLQFALDGVASISWTNGYLALLVLFYSRCGSQKILCNYQVRSWQLKFPKTLNLEDYTTISRRSEREDIEQPDRQ